MTDRKSRIEQLTDWLNATSERLERYNARTRALKAARKRLRP